MKRTDISGEQQAQQRFGTTTRAATFYANQTLDHLNRSMQQFIARQEMVVIATADAKGACDSSFRAGARGFVTVLDEKTLVYPEYRGNGVLASLGNIMENPHIGMLFLDYYLTTMGLHVNGQAHVLTPGEMEGIQQLPASILESMQVKGGRHPEAWVLGPSRKPMSIAPNMCRS